MRTEALTLLSFVAFTFAAKAQKFSLLPQVGFENSKTKVIYNNHPSFSPSGVVFSPQAALQLNYRFKSGHGFYVGAGSSRSVVAFSFTDPETGMSNYKSATGDMQLRLEGGYQFSSKPFYFKKKPAATKPAENKVAGKKSCGSFSYKSHCLKNKTSENRTATTDKAKQPAKINRGWMRLQPSVGLGYIPGTMTDVITKVQNGQAAYEYRAGNWNTALMTGMAFEFGRNNTRLLTVGFNYMKGIGNLNTQSVSTVVGTKTLTTQLDSKVSAWNMRIGVPFTLGAKKSTVKPQPQVQQKTKQGCSQYKIMYRCRKTI